jgi:hypothetical protein
VHGTGKKKRMVNERLQNVNGEVSDSNSNNNASERSLASETILNLIDEECVVTDASGKPVCAGPERLVLGMLKHHLPDGDYRLIGPNLTIDCRRKDGLVGPVPNGLAVEVDVRKLS